MADLNLHALDDYSTEEIKTEMARVIEIIERRRGQKPPAPSSFWTAVAARQRLLRELLVRKDVEGSDVALPADRQPLYRVEADQPSGNEA